MVRSRWGRALLARLGLPVGASGGNVSGLVLPSLAALLVAGGGFALSGHQRARAAGLPPSATPCGSLAECRYSLDAALPTPDPDDLPRAGRAARTLERRWSEVRRALARAERGRGRQQERQYAKARNALVRLMVTAHAAESQGRLGMPAAPVEAAVAHLLEMLPLTPTAVRGPSDRLVSYLLGRNASETTTTVTLRPASGEAMTTTTPADRTGRRLWRAERGRAPARDV
jgi:hypothetical protein